MIHFNPFSVPNEDPSGQSVILSNWEFYRIRNAARVLTEQEKKMEIDRQKEAKEDQMVSKISHKISPLIPIVLGVTLF